MNGMYIQAMLDGMAAIDQQVRAETQMTLGKLIDALRAMPEGATVSNICNPHSYRGYYIDLAFEKGEGTRLASDLLEECLGCMGEVFEGYKGGDFVMGALTPVWIACYGCCGVKLKDIDDDGAIVTEPETW